MAGLTFRPVHPLFGTEVAGIDLRAEFGASIQDRLVDAFNEHALLLFRGQAISDDDAERVAGLFGDISYEGGSGLRLFISTITVDKADPIEYGLATGELGFHNDKSFTMRPMKAIALFAHEVPPPGSGGDTMFASVERAYERLPAALRERIEGLKIVHSASERATHPMAFPHQVSGKKVVFYSKWFYQEVEGLGPDEGRRLVDELYTYITAPDNVYTHSWLPGDLIVWDNIKLQHARAKVDPTLRRHLRRFQIVEPGTAPAPGTSFGGNKVIDRRLRYR